MQLISKFNKGFVFYYLLLIISENKHGLFLWKIKKVLQLLMLFKKFLKEFNRKPIKIWVDKGSEFCNRSMKSWLEKNAIEMYLTHNEVKSVLAETLKNTIYKYMTSISKNVYIDKCVYSICY